MADAIHRLWEQNDQERLILPGSLPLFDSNVRQQPGWAAGIETRQTYTAGLELVEVVSDVEIMRREESVEAFEVLVHTLRALLGTF